MFAFSSASQFAAVNIPFSIHRPAFAGSAPAEFISEPARRSAVKCFLSQVALPFLQETPNPSLAQAEIQRAAPFSFRLAQTLGVTYMSTSTASLRSVGGLFLALAGSVAVAIGSFLVLAFVASALTEGWGGHASGLSCRARTIACSTKAPIAQIAIMLIAPASLR